VDLIIALDCSRSMLAGDIQPTRLERAKREIYDLLNMLEGDRVGLVAFGGTAFLQCPLTVDAQAFYLFLKVLTPDYLPVGGTDLAAAVQTALDAFDPQSPAEKAVILITDGENTGDQDPLEAARAAEKAGVKLFCIGVGSGDGVPVPAKGGGFQKDRNGQIVLSRLDETTLSRMALVTGGTYVRSVAGDMDLDAIYHDQIRAGMEQAELESGRKQVWADRFQWPLAIALALLFAALWLPPAGRNAAAALLVLILTLPPNLSPAMAGPLQEGYKAYQKELYDQALQKFIQGQLKAPEDPSVLYNLGNAYYKTGNYQAAKEHYAQALSHAPEALKPSLLYNLGNSDYRLGDLQGAVDHYQAALKAAPQDRQTRENLAYVKELLRKQQQQQSGNQGEPRDGRQQADQQQGGQPQQNQAGRDQSSQSQGSPGQARKDQQPQSASGDQTQRDRQEQQQGGRQQAPKPEQGPRPAEADPLNRLKDEPGRALMPAYQKRSVEKDW
jgi:Ca-activated chloride channel family protein